MTVASIFQSKTADYVRLTPDGSLTTNVEEMMSHEKVNANKNEMPLSGYTHKFVTCVLPTLVLYRLYLAKSRKKSQKVISLFVSATEN